jgi:DNA-binding response OmpR family regulator
MKILLVEDDQPTGSALADALRAQYYTVNLATDGLVGLDLARTHPYDLIVLDIVIPHLDGISLCQRLRAEGHQTPILLLTAKASGPDRVLGLDAGADDYMIKPFDLPELLARVRALLRRGKAVSSVITWETIQFDITNNEVTCNGQLIHLTPKEYCLLELFLLNPKRIFSRRAILDRLWDFAQSPGEETISTHIKCVRQKLKMAGASDPIETVHGLGYRLRTAASDPPLSPNQPDTSQQSLTPRQRVQTQITKTWEKHQTHVIGQITLLEQASQALTLGQLDSDLQRQAGQTAHKLAGSLGIFGMQQGTELARQLELLFHADLMSQSAQSQSAQTDAIAKTVMQLKQIVDQTIANQVIAHPVPPPPIASPTILLVDDDLMLIDCIRQAAIISNLRVEAATDLDVARQAIA